MAANNQGIMHLRVAGFIACKRGDGHMATELANFRTDEKPCKRCAAWLAKADERQVRRSAKAA